MARESEDLDAGNVARGYERFGALIVDRDKDGVHIQLALDGLQNEFRGLDDELTGLATVGSVPQQPSEMTYPRIPGRELGCQATASEASAALAAEAASTKAVNAAGSL